MTSKTFEERALFTGMVGLVLYAAKPNLVECELMTGHEAYRRFAHGPDKEFGLVYGGCRDTDEEYVVVTCANGYHYYINVDGDSLACIAEEIFKAMVCK
jgi:hypothetical protein